MRVQRVGHRRKRSVEVSTHHACAPYLENAASRLHPPGTRHDGPRDVLVPQCVGGGLCVEISGGKSRECREVVGHRMRGYEGVLVQQARETDENGSRSAYALSIALQVLAPERH